MILIKMEAERETKFYIYIFRMILVTNIRWKINFTIVSDLNK